jgi:hypothetical protein
MLDYLTAGLRAYLLASLLASAIPATADDDEPVQERLFDVTALLEPASNAPRTPLGLALAAKDRLASDDDDPLGHPLGTQDIYDLASLIEDHLDLEAEFDTPQRLRFVATPTRLAQVQALLDALAELRFEPVHLEVFEIEGPLSALAQLTAAGVLLDEGRFAQSLASPWRVLAHRTLEPRYGEIAGIARTQTALYHGQLVPLPSGGLTVRDDALRTGRVITLTPWRLAADVMRIDVKVEIATHAAQHATFDTGAGVVEQPQIAMTQLVGSMALPLGKAALALAWQDNAAVRAIVIRHHRRAPAAPRGGSLHAYDLRARFIAPPSIARPWQDGKMTFIESDDPESELLESVRAFLPEAVAESTRLTPWGGILFASHDDAATHDLLARWATQHEPLITTRMRVLIGDAPQLLAGGLAQLEALLTQGSKILACETLWQLSSVPGQRGGAAALNQRAIVLTTDREHDSARPDHDAWLAGSVIQCAAALHAGQEVLLNLVIEERHLLALEQRAARDGLRVQKPQESTTREQADLLLRSGDHRLVSLGHDRWLLIEAWVAR